MHQLMKKYFDNYQDARYVREKKRKLAKYDIEYKGTLTPIYRHSHLTLNLLAPTTVGARINP